MSSVENNTKSIHIHTHTKRPVHTKTNVDKFLAIKIQFKCTAVNASFKTDVCICMSSMQQFLFFFIIFYFFKETCFTFFFNALQAKTRTTNKICALGHLHYIKLQLSSAHENTFVLSYSEQWRKYSCISAVQQAPPTGRE